MNTNQGNKGEQNMNSKQEQQNELERALAAMQAGEAPAEQVSRATQQVWHRLLSTVPTAAAPLPERLRGCADFRAAMPLLVAGTLAESKRMLLEDHVSSCADCRKALDARRGNLRQFAPAARQRSGVMPFVPWAVAAALTLTAGYLSMDALDHLFAPSGARAEVSSVNGEIFKVSAAGLEPVKAGSSLGEKESLRTAKGSSAVVRLADGSLIEMNERAELNISSAYSGSTIHLDRGNIVVQAAKQKRGSLKVATRESTVSVKGTIFAVAAGLRGTQVAVVEGHVVVEQVSGAANKEDLLPGQVTASDASLKRTTVAQQIAWSKDYAKYFAMMGELSAIAKQIDALPMPSLRTQSRLLPLLPANTVVYAAIPNITGNIADATRIFDDRLKQSPVLQEWWNTKTVADVRLVMEKLRTAGAQLGDEIVFAAPSQGNPGIGMPFVLAEVKGAAAKAVLEGQIREILGAPTTPNGASTLFTITDRYIALAPDAATLAVLKPTLDSGAATAFGRGSFAGTIQESYRKGAGWIFAADLEQIVAKSVPSNVPASLVDINQLKHVMVERRDAAGRSDTRAGLSFNSTRRGVASWLAAPAPMSSLDYVSPDAAFAFSAVTKSGRAMAEEFFSVLNQMQPGSNPIQQIEAELGIKVVDDLAGPLGGEVSFAVDGALLPVPAWVLAMEVYDPARLTTSMRRIVESANKQIPAQQTGGLSFSEEMVSGRTWYRIKAGNMPVELNFTFANGYLLGASKREGITKAMQNRQTGFGLARSQRFRGLLPLDSQVNMSAVVYYNLGSSLKGIVDQMKTSLTLSEAQKKAMDQMAGNQSPVLICAYAEPQRLSVASTSGFFGFGIDTLLSAGKGMPILPAILDSALGQKVPFTQ
jgi:hypothetical protein